MRRSWLVLTALAVACPLLGGCVVTAGSGRSGAWAGFVFLFFPLFLVLLVTEGGGWDLGRAPLWTVLVAATAVGAAAILATYLPGRSPCRRSRVGLTPCAVVPVTLRICSAP